MESKVNVADPEYYLKTIEGLIPKPPKPIVMAEERKKVMAHHIFVQGPLGGGKTFIMSVLAHHWKQKAYGQGADIKLFSNYGLLDSYPMSHYTDWYGDEVANAGGSITCWDECQMAFFES